MKQKRNSLLAVMLCAFTAISSQAQQLKVPAASPLQTLKQNFALGDITIEYSRPSVKGRVIFGDLVPYGKIWRTGANAATKITFSDDIKVGDKDVKAGTYAVYTIPGKDTWNVMLYKDLTLGGNTADYKLENEVLRLKIKAGSTVNKTETFTMQISDMTSTSSTLELLWDKVRVAVNINADIDARIMKNIETSVIGDTRPYYSAATYYYDNNKDLNQALVWVNKSIEQNPKAYWAMMLKARIEFKLKDGKSAKATAEKVITMAREGNSDEFVAMAEKFIAENKL